MLDGQGQIRSTTMKSKRPTRPPGRREKAELSRQGAKAAARGSEPSENPMDDVKNSPEATGETPDVWIERRDAWQFGFDQQIEATQTTRPPTPAGRDDEHD